MEGLTQEETRLGTVVGLEEEKQNLSLIRRMKKGNKKGGHGKGHKEMKQDSGSSN